MQINNWLTESTDFVTILISLYGARSRSDIENRIFAELHPFLNKIENNDFVKSGLYLVKGLASIINSKAGVTINGAELFAGNVIKAIKSNPKKLAVIFDDVERADMPLPELLGYINEYVEHLQIPCILLADKEIWDEANKIQKSDKTPHKLSSTQEKVIGKVFQIQTTIEEVLNSWTTSNDFISDKTKDLLQRYQSLISNIVLRSGKNNFRAVKHALADLDWFLMSIDSWDKFEEDDFAMRFIAEFFILDYSIHLGDLTPSEIGVSKSGSLEAESKSTTYDLTLRKYRGIDTLSNYSAKFGDAWINVWKKALVDSLINVQNVKYIIENEIWFGGKDDFWLSRTHNWFLEDSDEAGLMALNALYTALEKKTIKDADLLYTFYYKFVFFANIGVLKENKKEFQDLILNYARNNAANFENYEMKEHDYWVSFWGEHGKNGQDDNEFFWNQLNDILEPFAQKSAASAKAHAFANFKELSKISENDVSKLVFEHEWSEDDFENFIDIYSSFANNYGPQRCIREAIETLHIHSCNKERFRQWLTRFYPFVERKWQEILKGTKPILNSQLSFYYLNKTVKDCLNTKTA